MQNRVSFLSDATSVKYYIEIEQVLYQVKSQFLLYWIAKIHPLIHPGKLQTRVQIIPRKSQFHLCFSQCYLPRAIINTPRMKVCLRYIFNPPNSVVCCHHTRERNALIYLPEKKATTRQYIRSMIFHVLILSMCLPFQISITVWICVQAPQCYIISILSEWDTL